MPFCCRNLVIFLKNLKEEELNFAKAIEAVVKRAVTRKFCSRGLI